MAESTQIIFINPDDKVSPATLAGLLNRNVSLIYQWGTTGRLPDIKNGSFTYRQCLDHLLSSLLRAEEAKILKVQEDTRIKEELARVKDENKRKKFSVNDRDGVTEYEDSMHPLMAAKLQQSIKTEYAREAELWQKIAIKNSEYVDFREKLDLVQPFILQIRDLLLGIAIDFPEAEKTIDEGMEHLYNLGCKILEEVKIDREGFVEEMLSRNPTSEEQI